MIKHMTTPLTQSQALALQAGDQVLLSGVIYTARDAAHKRLVALIEKGEELPFDVKDQIIYYVGPTPAKPGHVFGSGGPTTSGRMDAYAKALMQLGLRGMIGKGYRQDHVKQAIMDYQSIYFGQCIQSCEVIAFEDLGPEAIRRLVVKDLPLTVVIDCYGHDLYEMGRSQYLKEHNHDNS